MEIISCERRLFQWVWCLTGKRGSGLRGSRNCAPWETVFIPYFCIYVSSLFCFLSSSHSFISYKKMAGFFTLGMFSWGDFILFSTSLSAYKKNEELWAAVKGSVCRQQQNGVCYNTQKRPAASCGRLRKEEALQRASPLYAQGRYIQSKEGVWVRNLTS